ncbi:transposase [Micromonospora sp. WMMA1949]|uniref:transposase n=1 Tax=Micromonospora sp. WMMA1949 TaxID=3015162 RepID=UPI003FA59DA4
MAGRSKYPEEFRRQTAALVLDSGRTIRDVGRERGVNHETLRNWVQPGLGIGSCRSTDTNPQACGQRVAMGRGAPFPW